MSATVPPAKIPWIALIDGEMAALTDTELRVLLVVLRQTVGRGKTRDWIARSQMVSRTGRSPDAVSRAVDSLVLQGRLQVEDAAGRLHDTPESRRAARTALYFRLGRKLFPPSSSLNLRVISNDTTETNNHNKHPVVAYDKTPGESMVTSTSVLTKTWTPAPAPASSADEETKGEAVDTPDPNPPAIPDWLRETAPQTAAESARIEREKNLIWEKLRRGV